jgi:phage-related protein
MSTNFVKEIADAFADSVTKLFENLTSSVDALNETINTTAGADARREEIDAATAAFEATIRTIEDQEAVNVGGTGIDMGDQVDHFQKIGDILGSGLEKVQAISDSFESMSQSMDPVTKVKKANWKVMQGAMGAVKDIATKGKAGVVSGVLQLVSSLIEAFLTITGVLEPFQVLFELFANTLQAALAPAIEKLWDVLLSDEVIEATIAIGNAVGRILAPGIDIFRRIIDKLISSGILELIIEGFEILATSTENFFVALEPLAEPLLDLIADALIFMAEASNQFMMALQPLAEPMANLFRVLIQLFIDMVNRVDWDAILEGIIALTESIVNMIINIPWETLTPLFNGFIQVINWIIEGINWFVNSLNGILNIFNQNTEKQAGKMGTLFNLITSSITFFKDNFKNFDEGIKPIVNSIKIVLNIFKNSMKSLKEFLQPIIDFFKGLVPDIGEGTKDFAQNVSQSFNQATQNASNFFQQSAQNVGAWANDVATSVESGLQQAGSFFNEVGQSVGSGLNKAGQAVGGFFGDLFGLQEGGVVMKPTIAALAEGGEPEAVIPLSRLGDFGGGGGGGDTINVNITGVVGNEQVEMVSRKLWEYQATRFTRRR